MLNNVTIQGRIANELELKTTQNGTSVVAFAVACQRDIADKSGERETDFIDVVAWGKTAEFVSKYFAKGNMTVIIGRLQVRTWTDKAENKRKTTEVIARDVYFGESKKTHTGDSGTNNSVERGEEQGLFDDDELPF